MNSKLYVLVTQSENESKEAPKNNTSIFYELYRVSTSFKSSRSTNDLISNVMATYNEDTKRIEFTMADMFIWNRRNNLRGKLFNAGMVDNKPYITQGQKLSNDKWVGGQTSHTAVQKKLAAINSYLLS